MTPLACALGVRQTSLDPDRRAFFREAAPWAFIMFREACESREQVRRLCAELREAAGHDAVIWIDQEGGRVARLQPPEWPLFPPAARYGDLYAGDREAGLDATWLGHRLIAHELKAMGVDASYAPVLDLPAPGADPIIGDRAFALQPGAIAALGRAAMLGLHAGGVLSCIKHIPGHGRAEADSHLALPRVAASAAALEQDFAPFAALNDAPSAMTAHVVYEAYDAMRPATCSPTVIGEVIRGAIGFDGLLMSDDLDMKALARAPGVNDPEAIWPLRGRAEAAFAAGCDLVLQCNGELADMTAVAEGTPRLAGAALARAQAAERIARQSPDSFDAADGWKRLLKRLGRPWSPEFSAPSA